MNDTDEYTKHGLLPNRAGQQAIKEIKLKQEIQRLETELAQEREWVKKLENELMGLMVWQIVELSDEQIDSKIKDNHNG